MAHNWIQRNPSQSHLRLALSGLQASPFWRVHLGPSWLHLVSQSRSRHWNPQSAPLQHHLLALFRQSWCHPRAITWSHPLAPFQRLPTLPTPCSNQPSDSGPSLASRFGFRYCPASIVVAQSPLQGSATVYGQWWRYASHILVSHGSRPRTPLCHECSRTPPLDS